MNDKQPITQNRGKTSADNQKLNLKTERVFKSVWIVLFVQPLLFLACGILLIAGLGVAQRFGFISSGGSGSSSTHKANSDENARYICPMMCTPPLSEPGRCPVCGMELEPIKSGGNSDFRSVQIDPATRRIANIQTAAVRLMSVSREIQAIGRLHYDESSLKTISAYVDGRIEKLYADYTGVVVKENDQLALIYSPRLYSSQVELLLAKRVRDDSKSSTLLRVAESNQDLLESSRQRLIELGMTQSQITELETTGEANSRLHLYAPISGTVIKKFAVEGEYVKEGQPIYKLADLSTVWLMLELFPKDAAAVHYGQRVQATIQSYPGKLFSGRVAFIDPEVDPKTRTIGVRVVIPNTNGLLKIGDYAQATISVPISGNGESPFSLYDAELADKWISPRHPHIIEDAPGKCPLCNIDLVPASKFGFLDSSGVSEETLVVPRSAVLMAGNNSVLYVETEPGRFEIRPITLGPTSGDQIVILGGVKEGEKVAIRGNFLIDSQMQLVGNPSLIDPSRAIPTQQDKFSPEALEAIALLSISDQELANNQRICPVTEMSLGSMGMPKKVDVNGKPILICCEGCRKPLLDDPDKFLSVLEKYSEDSQEKSDVDIPEMEIPAITPIPQLSPIEEIPKLEKILKSEDLK